MPGEPPPRRNWSRRAESSQSDRRGRAEGPERERPGGPAGRLGDAEPGSGRRGGVAGVDAAAPADWGRGRGAVGAGAKGLSVPSNSLGATGRRTPGGSRCGRPPPPDPGRFTPGGPASAPEGRRGGRLTSSKPWDAVRSGRRAPEEGPPVATGRSPGLRPVLPSPAWGRPPAPDRSRPAGGEASTGTFLAMSG